MKKALLLILGIVAVCFLIANADYLAEFLNTMKTGALVPLCIAVALMVARHFVQAASYDAAFDAVGHATGFWHNVVLIFSLVFINTFCLFSGATGVAFIIDDAHRKGLSAGAATGGAILSQIGYFAAVFVISVIGFLTMLISGHANTVFLVGGLALACVLVALSSLFIVGNVRPRVLFRLFMLLERAINRVLGLAHKSLGPAWGRKTANSLISTSKLLAKNPKGTFITVAWASFSAILNMACLVAIGYAFGCTSVEALVAAFAVGAISVILSPTPQGVGVVEAMITAILTAYGTSVATAAAIALVYRGIMFWIPFCAGALMLSQSGFFKSKKDATADQRSKDVAWVSGTLVFLLGAVNAFAIFDPSLLTPYTALTSWVDISSLMVGVPLLVASALLIAASLGLVRRSRMAWAVAVCMLILIAGAELLFKGTAKVSLVCLAMAAWLFWKRAAFDKH
jgi:phosphatidylglycerol lysyltransferase